MHPVGIVIDRPTAIAMGAGDDFKPENGLRGFELVESQKAAQTAPTIRHRHFLPSRNFNRGSVGCADR
jgi:hypothetical protein